MSARLVRQPLAWAYTAEYGKLFHRLISSIGRAVASSVMRAGSIPVSNSRKLAHLVEQSVYRRFVIGSNPILSTNTPSLWVRAPCYGQGSLIAKFSIGKNLILTGSFYYSVMRVFCHSEGASATVFLASLSMPFLCPIWFLHGEEKVGKVNGIFESCFLMLDCHWVVWWKERQSSSSFSEAFARTKTVNTCNGRVKKYCVLILILILAWACIAVDNWQLTVIYLLTLMFVYYLAMERAKHSDR